jgi:hypothetical protein
VQTQQNPPHKKKALRAETVTMAIAAGTRFWVKGYPVGGSARPSYDVARDGRFLMVASLDSSDAAIGASIVVVQNWFEELKQRVPRD